jgi:hypothetical protein
MHFSNVDLQMVLRPRASDVPTRPQRSPGVGDGEAKSEDSTILDTYAHVPPGMQETAVNTITELLSE